MELFLPPSTVASGFASGPMGFGMGLSNDPIPMVVSPLAGPTTFVLSSQSPFDQHIAAKLGYEHPLSMCL
jgi:hypothetical protein